MASTLEIDHKKMHDIKSAAELAGYSRDHVATLARSGKIVAAQIERQWYIDVDSLRQYAHITSLEQQVKQKHLSDERKSGQDLKKELKSQKTRKATHRKVYEKNLHTSLAGFLLFFGVMGGVLGFFAPEFLLLTNTQIASLTGVSSQLSEAESIVIRDDVGRERAVFGDGSVEVSILADDGEAIVLLPESMQGIEEMFSDPVELVERDGRLELQLAGKSQSAIGTVVIPISEVPVP